MTWGWGPFAEKPEGGISATRTIAIMLGVVVSRGIWKLADTAHLHDVGWPFAAIVAVTVLAVPLQAMFRAVTAWPQSSQGKTLIEKLISKVASAPLTLEPSPATEPGAVTTTTTVTPPEA